jgi:hypothetical protein
MNRFLIRFLIAPAQRIVRAVVLWAIGDDLYVTNLAVIGLIGVSEETAQALLWAGRRLNHKELRAHAQEALRRTDAILRRVGPRPSNTTEGA